MIKKIDKVLSSITGGIMYVSYVGILLIMVITVADVLMRRLASKGIVGSYEIVERILLVMIFAAFAYTQTHKGHIHVTLFISKFPKAVRMCLFGFLGLLSTFAAGFCAWAIMEQGAYSYTAMTTTAVLFIPLYPFFYIAAVCMLIFAVTLLWDSIKCFIGIRDEEVCKEMQSSWE